jgi:aspartate kinase
MSLIVQKYGGTSVADLNRIRNVAKRIIKSYDSGNDLVVILSAMSGVTDGLINLAEQATETPDKRELDVLMATGEQTTAALMAMILKSMDYPATSLLGYQAGVVTDFAYGNARIVDIGTDRLKGLIKERKIIIVAGFQGSDPDGNITTLGRGGSDTTAVAIAAVLKADVCEIYTDVDGIYTTDPSICSNARKLKRISYDETLEMSSLGAKILQIRSVEFASKYNVSVHVRSSFSEEEGTMVVNEEEGMERIVVSGVTLDKNQARITLKKIPDQPGIAVKVFKPISAAGIVVDMIIQSSGDKGKNDISFTVPKGDFKKTMEIEERVVEELGAEAVKGYGDIAKVSVVGVGMKNHSGVATKMFSTLANENINIRMISTSEIRISCVVDEKYAELAVRVLHDAFELGE